MGCGPKLGHYCDQSGPIGEKNAQTLHVRDYLSNYISLNMKDVSELRLPNDVGELVRICAHM